MKEQKITDILKSTISNYKMTPHEISTGNCDQFAWDVAEKIKGAQVCENREDSIYTTKSGEKEWIPNHFWIKVGNKYYDAETIHGVDDYHDLPPFRRAKVPKRTKFIVCY